MKKRFLILLSLLFALSLLSGCGSGTDTATTADTVETAGIVETTASESDAASTTPPESQTNKIPLNPTAKTPNGVFEAYYTDDAPESVSSEAIAAYISGGSASERLATLYADSDEMSSVPILGTYLEKTSLFICLFEKQGELVGTVAVNVGNNGSVTVELNELLKDYVIGHNFRDSVVLSVLSRCRTSYPDFHLQGVVYTEPGFPTFYPVGNDGDDEKILYYYGDTMGEFRLVDSFSSLEEGRAKFNAYWEFRANEIAKLSIFVFEWRDVPLYSSGYLSKFAGEDVYHSGEDIKSYQYLYDYDWNIVVPLLGLDGREGQYVLHLLYLKDKLIAEVLLENCSDGIIRAVKAVVSDKDPSTGDYLGLNSIDYVEKCNQLLYSNGVKGIGFDGEDYFVAYR